MPLLKLGILESNFLCYPFTKSEWKLVGSFVFNSYRSSSLSSRYTNFFFWICWGRWGTISACLSVPSLIWLQYRCMMWRKTQINANGSPAVGVTTSVRLHICAVSYMTDISLHVSSNTNKLNSTQLTHFVSKTNGLTTIQYPASIICHKWRCFFNLVIIQRPWCFYCKFLLTCPKVEMNLGFILIFWTFFCCYVYMCSLFKSKYVIENIIHYHDFLM